MFMRVVRSHGLTPEKLRAMLDTFRRDYCPRLEEAPGCMGLIAGENRSGGSFASVTFWETEGALRETDRLAAEYREGTAMLYERSQAFVIERFEVAFTTHMAFACDGPAALRIVRFHELTREKMDAAGDRYRHVVRSGQADVPGLWGFAFGANPDAGSCGAVSLWDSHRSLRESEQLSRRTREAAATDSQLANPLADRWPLEDRFDVRVTVGLEPLCKVEDLYEASPVSA